MKQKVRKKYGDVDDMSSTIVKRDLHLAQKSMHVARNLILGEISYSIRVPNPNNVLVGGNHFWFFRIKSAMPLNVQNWTVVPAK